MKQTGFRFTDEELSLLDSKAKALGVGRTEFLKILINTGVITSSYTKSEKVITESYTNEKDIVQEKKSVVQNKNEKLEKARGALSGYEVLMKKRKEDEERGRRNREIKFE